MQEEEIDLKKLYREFQQSRTYQKLERSIFFIFRNNLWFVFFLLLGTAAGYYYVAQIPPVYESKMILQSKILNNYINRDLIDNLNRKIKANDFRDKENFSKEIAAHILEVNFYDQRNELFAMEETYITNILQPQYTVPDQLNNEELFTLTIKSSRADLHSVIADEIIGYLENNVYSKTQITDFHQLLEKKEELLKNEISTIDSLLQINTDQLSAAVAGLIAEKTDASKEILDIGNLLKDKNNFELISQTPAVEIPRGSSKYLILLFAVLAFVCGGIILYLFKR